MGAMKKYRFTCAALTAAALLAAFPPPSAAEVGKTSCLTEKAVQYKSVEISASISAKYDNPYDPSQIEVSASITSPSGKKLIVPSFHSSGSSWITRFTPVETGKYSYAISEKSSGTASSSPSYNIDVTPGEGDGFIRKCGANPYYLKFDSGRPFFGLGHNIGWVPGDKAHTFEQYFKLFRENGCNLTRVWMNVPWAMPFEMDKLGRYSEGTARNIDALIKASEKYGVYIILVFDSYSTLMAETGPWGEESWADNPYNSKKGGPCKEPQDFFTDNAAKIYYKNRVRYIMARWGYSPNIIAFELWNEFDAPAGWVAEMAAYIRSINPHGQLVTTSMGYPWSNNFEESDVWKTGGLDFIDYHIYGDQTANAIGTLASLADELTKRFKMPFLVGEFGISAAESDGAIDIAGAGRELHNSIWAAAMSRSFAGSLNWWWEEYVKRKNLYPHYRALRNFTEGTDWGSVKADYLKTGPVTLYVGEDKQPEFSDITVPTKELWGNRDFGEFTIRPDGSVSGGLINAYLHGKYHEKEMKVSPVIHVDYPEDGLFIIKVGMVSQGGHLMVYVDDEKVFEEDFPAGACEGPWQRSTYRPDYKIYQCLYNKNIEIPVTKGSHTIRLDNTGADWIGIKRFTLTNYTSNLVLDSRIAALALDKEMLVWIQDKSDGAEGPETVSDASFKIEDVEDTTYSAEWWDTLEGEVLSTVNVKASDGELTLHIPPFTGDIACKIRKLS